MLLEVCLFLFLLALIVDNYRQKSSAPDPTNIDKLPIISKIPIFGSLLALASFQPDNLHLKFQEYVRRFGLTFQARVFGVRVVVTADGRYVEQLLSSQQHTRKHVIYMLLRSWLGDGLLLSHGAKWQTMRKIITPTFHFKILESFVEVFDRQSKIMVERLQPLVADAAASANEAGGGAAIVDIYPHVGLATLDIIAETAMGVCVNAQLDSKSDFVQAVKDVTNILATRFIRPHLGFPWLFRLLTPMLYRKQQEGIAVMHDFTEKIIEQRRRALKASTRVAVVDGEEEDIGIKSRLALLDVLLQSSSDGGKPLSDEQIREEVNTFMFEGHDTTTSAISFCLYLLSRHAECQQKLFEEIRAHFGDDLAEERPISYRDLQDLGYLSCVVKEALRLYPPIPAIGRWLKEDCELVDVTLPAGTNVIILLWQLLRDAEVFPEPERFWPERHLEQSQAMPHSRASAFSNIPFSAGPRNCIGQRFALLEIKTLVVNILRHFELLPLGEAVQPSIKIVLRSKTGVNFGIRPRAY